MNQLLKQALAIGEARGYLRRTQCGTTGVLYDYEEPKDDVEIDPMLLSSLLLTHANGNSPLAKQTGNLEPLQNYQKLVIPSALGMAINTGGTQQRCTGNSVLRARYLRVTTLTYAQFACFVDGEYSPTQICGIVDNLAEPVNQVRRTDWFEEAWYLDADGKRVLPDQGVTTTGAFSKILQFNCDVRDYGFLLTPEGTTTDTAWREIGTLEEDRLKVCLQPYSLECIAALNYVPVGSFPLFAWVRAYGIAFGVTPFDNSAELYFTTTMPSDNDINAVTNFEKRHDKLLVSLATNVIAMFGFMHLSKDRTYRTGDTNLEGIGSSYINMLRTLTSQGLVNQMIANKESIIRTASQPFGLAQTYWLGKAMHKFKLLTAPLMDKHDVTPPRVRRLMIVDMVSREWDEFHAGRAISQLYAKELNMIRNEIARVRGNEPSYSDYHSFYGCQDKSKISADAETTSNSMLPIVYGFVMTTHVNNHGKRDGLARALCWKSVERDHERMAYFWKEKMGEICRRSGSDPLSVSPEWG